MSATGGPRAGRATTWGWTACPRRRSGPTSAPASAGESGSAVGGLELRRRRLAVDGGGGLDGDGAGRDRRGAGVEGLVRRVAGRHAGDGSRAVRGDQFDGER